MHHVLDLFCGAAGGWSLGLHRAGYTTVTAAESDGWRRKQFLLNFPGVVMFDDVREVTADRLIRRLGSLPDIVVGSPPCQDASQANAKGRGIDGDQTGLFFEALRIVREIRPRWAAFENVPGIRTRGYDRVHDELEDAGYAVWPLVVGAVHAGAPHRRSRLWAVAHRHGFDGGRPLAGRKDGEKPQGQVVGHAPHPDQVRELQPGGPVAHIGRRFGDAPKSDVAHPGRQRRQEQRMDSGNCHQPQELAALARRLEEGWGHWNGGPPPNLGVDDGLPQGMAGRIVSAYGDAVMPIIPELIGKGMKMLEQMSPGISIP